MSSCENDEIQNLQAELARYKEHVEHLEHELERYKALFHSVGGWVHEFRTPLSGIIGYPLLLLETPLNQEQREHVEKMQQCSQVLLKAINAFADYIRNLENVNTEAQFKIWRENPL